MDVSLPIAGAGVSDREAEVLALVGDHLTNAEIARRLFISVRTVESHVSSLLRKLDVADRRSLADLSGALGDTARALALPTPLTSFVGRVAERAALADAVAEHRLVTAVGPGGVGKTRLAVALAADTADRFADGARYVDLVPVTDPAMVGAAVASSLGFGDQPGRSPTQTVISKLAGAEVLVVVDNCEHLLGGVSALLERLLGECRGVTVLATSRARLQLPFEFVFPVPGMSLDTAAGEGDATTMFYARAAMTGWSSPYADDRRRISTICDRLDGVALAIELAAARVSTLGLDGLLRGLSNQLGLLTGGPRLDERHRSVRSTLDWSFGLLEEKDQVVFRRASVFAAPLAPAAAVMVAGHPPLMPGEVPGALARLADHSLLEVVAGGPGGTRYRMLETIRQYGAELRAEVGDDTETRTHHLRWCLATAGRLQEDAETGTVFDEVADDLRAGLGWAAGRPELRAEAHQLALFLARLTYVRGRLSEAQDRYEEAAALAADNADVAGALHLAATVAWGRHAGNEAIRLYRAAADAAVRAGDPRRAALELTSAGQVITNAPGVMSEVAPPGEERVLLKAARALAAGDVHVEAAMITITTPEDEFDPGFADLAERAVELAHRVGDTRLESHALDQLTAVHLIWGRYREAVNTVRRRLELLAPCSDEVEMAWEYSDALHMAPMVHVAAGDLQTARWHALQRSALPIFRESDHLAVEWLLPTAAIAGDFDEAVELARRFHRGWVEAGQPPLGGIAFAPAAAAMVYGIQGDEDSRQEWLRITAEMRRVVEPMRGQTTYTPLSPTFDGIVALHRGEIDAALRHVAAAPESYKSWHGAVWRPWYAAVWAEAGVLGRLADRRARLDRARFVVRENPIAAALVERADAVDVGDTRRLLAAAAALDAAGCRYQHARTLVLAGGEARAEGEQILASIGATPMARS